MATTRNTAALLTATLITLGSLAGEANAGVVINDAFRYFQHQGGTAATDDAFMGVCFSAAGYNMMLGIVSAGKGTWTAGMGGTEAYGTSIAGKYNDVKSHTEHNDGDLINQPTTWKTANENFVANYLTAAKGDKYITRDYSLADLGKINAARAIGAMALVDRVDIADADLVKGEWWGNFHVVSLYELDLKNRTVKFTDSNIDKVGTEYTGQANHTERQDFQYGILSGGGQTLSWTAAGIITNADGTNMDDELLASIRVVYLNNVPEPSSLLLLGLGGVCILIRRSRIKGGQNCFQSN